jgi:putative PIN family toxin of toxin-antitoxin system
LIVVFDTSSLVGAALRPGGVPEIVLLTVIERATLAVSREIVDEYRAVLSRPKFARVLSAERREAILELIEVMTRWVQPVERVTDCRDKKDNMYLELAAAAGASLLVSSDADLLDLDPWRDVRILTPAAFLAHIGKAPSG